MLAIVTTLFVSQPRCALAHDQPEACGYRVEWQINPHMVIGAADGERACAEHAAYVAALRDAGARVVRLPFIHGAYDSVFVKDSAIVVDDRVLPATVRHAERRAEPPVRARQLARLGMTVLRPLDTPIEGGDVLVVRHRRIALMGHGFRTAAESAGPLARALGCEVVPLELVDPALYHLDTALAVLADDTLLACAEAFSPRARETLASLGFAKVAWVPRAEAMQFALNVVEVGATVVTGSRVVPAALRGRRVIRSPLDQFLLAGGSAACLVARANVTCSARELRASPVRACGRRLQPRDRTLARVHAESVAAHGRAGGVRRGPRAAGGDRGRR